MSHIKLILGDDTTCRPSSYIYIDPTNKREDIRRSLYTWLPGIQASLSIGWSSSWTVGKPFSLPPNLYLTSGNVSYNEYEPVL